MERRRIFLLLFTTLVLLTFRGDKDDSVPAFGEEWAVSPEEVLHYFCEIAFGSELGESPPFLTRWVSPVSIAVRGNPGEEDLRLIEDLLASLNLVEGFPGIRFSEGEADLTVFFLPRDQLEKQFSLWQKGDRGIVEYVWNRKSGVITRATVGIDENLRFGRAATVAEEILQALGLGQDSVTFSNSVFYDHDTALDGPMELDILLVSLLYHPSLRPGMTKEEALPYLEKILGTEAVT